MSNFLGNIRAWLTILVLLIGGPVVIIAGFSDARHHAALKDHGKEALAVVDGVSWKEKRVSGREKNFKVQVHFETEAKQTVQAEVSVSKEVGQRLRDTPGEQTLKVRYLPEQPHKAVLADATEDSSLMYAIGAGMFLVGGFLLLRRLKASPNPASAQA